MLALLCCLTSLALAANPPVAAISGIALNQFGQPLAYAQMRICSVTSTGTPCTPPSTVYQDYALTIPIGSPTTDQYGNYLFYAPALDYPNLYEIQISAGQGLYWTYVQNGPSSGSGGGGCEPIGPLYAVQSQNPLTDCYGEENLLWYPSPLGTNEGSELYLGADGKDTTDLVVQGSTGDSVTVTGDYLYAVSTNATDSISGVATNQHLTGFSGVGVSGTGVDFNGDGAYGVEGSAIEGVGATPPGGQLYDFLADAIPAGSGSAQYGFEIQNVNGIALHILDQAGSNAIVQEGAGDTNVLNGQTSVYNWVNIAPTTTPGVGYADLNITPHGSEYAAGFGGPVSILQNPINVPSSDLYIVSVEGEPTIESRGAINLDANLAGHAPSSGAADLTVTPYSTEPAAKFNGRVIITPLGSSTSPVCPNGTGGALTTTGCLTGPITSIEANGTPITPSAGAVNLAAGTNVTLTTVGNTTTITSSATAATAFSALTTATNTSAAMTVGSGASLGTSGTGTITATGMPTSGLTGTTLPSSIITSSLTSAAGGAFGTAAYDAATAFDAAGAAAARAAVAACTSGQYASATLTSGITCGQVQFSQVGGTPSTTQVPFQSLTTTGTTGAATLSSGILNVPNYTYTLPTATSSVLGGVKPDGTSILNSSGVISVTPTSVGLGNVTNFTQTKAAIMPNTSPTSGQIPVGNSGGTAYAPVTVSGDATLASTGALTVNSSGGVAFGTGAFSAAPTITAIQNATVAVTPSAGAINFTPGANMTLTTTGNTITLAASSTAATAFSALTGSTNTSAAMVVGTGASLAVSGTGTIAATTATTATNFTGSLAGDVTGTQSATSVGKINGGTIPASATVVGTNGAGQIVAGPSSLPPNGSAGGDLSGSYPNPTVAKVNGLAVPTSQTVVGTNGSGQFIAGPSSLPPNGTAGGDLSGSYPNPTVAKINGGTVPTSAPLLATNSSAAPVAVTITGLVKGNGSSAVTAAVAGTDYLTPTGSGASLTGITSSQVGAIQKVASGTIALPTSSIATGTCATATATATGALTTDVLNMSPNADITGVTGYAPTGQIVQIYPPWLTAGQVNVKVCNPVGNSSAITPGAVTLVWNVGR